MNRKIIKQKIEESLTESQMDFNIIENKKREWINFSLNFKQNNSLSNEIFSNEEAYISIYKNYMVFHLFGWEYLEKFIIDDEKSGINFLKLLNSFLEKRMKLKVYCSKYHIYKWKVYILNENQWKLSYQNHKFFHFFYSEDKVFEINTEYFSKIKTEKLKN